MYCSKCGSLEDKVIDSRLAKDGRSIRRRRECITCSHRYTTYEEIERADLRVVKRDGRSEPFDRHKLQTGMVKACEKRPVSVETIELAAESIIRDIEADFPKEIPSHVVGAKVMEKLHGLDAVAYVRFASVYQDFKDVKEFVSSLESALKSPNPNQDFEL